MNDNDLIVQESWATKYRPSRLEHFIGQDAAVNTLRGMWKTKRIPAAFLITGPTGVGKTSFGRYIAAHINKVDPLKENPDLVEHNIGDETGIANIRNIVDSTRLLPRRNFRVMLLDEVAALSRQASNAVLKPLEEPHPRLVWILCTDQPEKLLPTIVNRCVRLHLQRVEPRDLMILMKEVYRDERLNFGPDKDQILRQVTQVVGGQPRMGLQLLQGVHWQIEGGVKRSEALRIAAENLPEWALDRVAVKMLAKIYEGKLNTVLKTISEAENAAGLIDLSLKLNRYLIDRLSGTTRTWIDYPRKQLIGYLQQQRIEPRPREIFGVHRVLTQCRRDSTAFAVPEIDVLYTAMGEYLARRS